VWFDVARARRELVHLNEQSVAAREVLARLQRDVREAENFLGDSKSVQLLEANQHLVVATLKAQADAETTARLLRDVPRPAELDSLTKLPNRVLLLDRLAKAKGAAKLRGSKCALMRVDLNDFRQINDTLGHEISDEILVAAAQRLVATVRPMDTVSRYGGDEFLVLLADVPRAADAGLMASHLAEALGLPLVAGGHLVNLTASVGIAIYPDDGEDTRLLIDRADAAMYRAKRQGVRRFVFHGEKPLGELSMPLPHIDRIRQHPSHVGLATTGQDDLYLQLREANEHLLMAALGAQELQGAAEHARKRQTELLAVVAHELRNPLQPIRAAAAMLSRLGGDDRLLPKVQSIIERQVAHMSRLVGDLLDVSRVNTGKLRLERSVVALIEVISTTADACLPAMKLRAQHFEISLPEQALDVYADPVRLAQVFSNLLDNACKYTPDNGTISLAVRHLGDTVVVSLNDNGIGISASALPEVFEPFVQDPLAVGFNSVGLGIGLTVVRELVEAHGGHVTASSAGIGLGSQFVVTLPLLQLSLVRS
jgi:diguanylate cyclase (GGDEF)-like protein